MKNLYSKPLMVVEQFTPQEFVASCVVPQTPSQLGVVFYADIFNERTSYEGNYGSSDGICQTSCECFSNGRAPAGAQNSNHPGRGWYRGYPLYICNVTQSNGKQYNSSAFSIMNGYGNVDIYISRNGVDAFIYKDGAPDDVTIGPDGKPQPTFS